MAIELVRQVWCDQCLREDKKKVTGIEAVATLSQHGRLIQFDGCPKHDNPRITEVSAYGYAVEPTRSDPRKQSEKTRAAVKTGKPLVQCSVCDKQISAGAGAALHGNAHSRKGEGNATFIPVVE
jgi:hypothetical protein